MQTGKLSEIRRQVTYHPIFSGCERPIFSLRHDRVSGSGICGVRSKSKLPIFPIYPMLKRLMGQGIWKCVGAESRTIFSEVDLSEDEWVDYDEKVATMSSNVKYSTDDRTTRLLYPLAFRQSRASGGGHKHSNFRLDEIIVNIVQQIQHVH